MDLHLVSLFSYVHAPFFSTIERTHMRHPIYRTLMPKTRLCQTQNTEEVNVHGLNGSIDDVERNVKVGGKPHSRNSVAFRSESPLPTLLIRRIVKLPLVSFLDEHAPVQASIAQCTSLPAMCLPIFSLISLENRRALCFAGLVRDRRGKRKIWTQKEAVVTAIMAKDLSNECKTLRESRQRVCLHFEAFYVSCIQIEKKYYR